MGEVISRIISILFSDYITIYPVVLICPLMNSHRNARGQESVCFYIIVAYNFNKNNVGIVLDNITGRMSFNSPQKKERLYGNGHSYRPKGIVPV